MIGELSNLKGKRVLVTGSTGFKGSWLCQWLLELGADVYGFALAPEPDAPLFNQLKLDERIHQTIGDIRDIDAVNKVFADTKPEVVLHLAAQALVRRSYVEPKETFDTNVGGGVNLLEAVRASDTVRALVFVTSDKCYRNKEWAWGYRENDELGGADPYSASKAAVELVFGAYQQSYFKDKKDFLAASARAGNVIGGGDMSADRIVPDCIRALQAGNPIAVRNPNSTRPWQHVLEPLSGYLQVAARLLDGKENIAGSWNFGPNPENVLPVGDLVETAIEVWGSGSHAYAEERNAPHEAGLLMLSVDKAKSQLGWHPHWDFADAVGHTVKWYKRVGEGEDPVAVTLEQIRNFEGAGK
ncbi:MAG: CDP-glucose 4,6-dehydratase [Sphingomonadales bacterium]|nr:CDP-glucose 4,6-dehydratase [Sphingomonadales bacterium]